MHYYSPGDRGRWPSRTWKMGGLRLNLRLPRSYCAIGAVAVPMRQSGLTKTEADDLLDWLESNGCRRFELLASGDREFAVRWWN